jgi:site-specific recombinase XerD
MHDLIPFGPTLPGTLTVAEIDATMAYAEAEKAQATRAAYASDWRDFAAWCASRGATTLPAHVGIVAAYLSGLADSGRKSSTIGRRAAAIGYHHKIAGHEPPTNNEGVKATLRGIRRTIGSAKQGKAPATADLIGQMLALCPDTMIGKRDRALLALGFAGAFRRSELVALEVADLVETPDGLRVTIRRSKTDQEGQGLEVLLHGCRKDRSVDTLPKAAHLRNVGQDARTPDAARAGRLSGGDHRHCPERTAH